MIVEEAVPLTDHVKPPSLPPHVASPPAGRAGAASPDDQLQEYLFSDGTWGRVAALARGVLAAPASAATSAPGAPAGLDAAAAALGPSPAGLALHMELTRSARLLGRVCVPVAATREDVFAAIKAECAVIGGAVQTVEEISIEGNHQLFVAGHLIFVEFIFDAEDRSLKVKIEFPDDEISAEKGQFEEFLLRAVKEGRVRELKQGINYLAQIDLMAHLKEGHACWNMMALARDFAKLKQQGATHPNQGLGEPFVHQQRLGVSLVYYVRPAILRRDPSRYSLDEDDIYSVTISLEQMPPDQPLGMVLTPERASFLDTNGLLDNSLDPVVSSAAPPGAMLCKIAFACELHPPMVVSAETLSELDALGILYVATDPTISLEALLNLPAPSPDAAPVNRARVLQRVLLRSLASVSMLVSLLRRQAAFNSTVYGGPQPANWGPMGAGAGSSAGAAGVGGSGAGAAAGTGAGAGAPAGSNPAPPVATAVVLGKFPGVTLSIMGVVVQAVLQRADVLTAAPGAPEWVWGVVSGGILDDARAGRALDAAGKLDPWCKWVARLMMAQVSSAAATAAAAATGVAVPAIATG